MNSLTCPRDRPTAWGLFEEGYLGAAIRKAKEKFRGRRVPIVFLEWDALLQREGARGLGSAADHAERDPAGPLQMAKK